MVNSATPGQKYFLSFYSCSYTLYNFLISKCYGYCFQQRLRWATQPIRQLAHARIIVCGFASNITHIDFDLLFSVSCMFYDQIFVYESLLPFCKEWFDIYIFVYMYIFYVELYIKKRL